jgi:hypothetical protein
MATSNFYNMGGFFPLYVSTYDDELISEYDIREIERECGKANASLKSFEMKVLSGYYSSFQLYVEPLVDNFKTKKAEINKVKKHLKNIAEQFGLEEIVVFAKFSNGETIYKRKSELNENQ